MLFLLSSPFDLLVRFHLFLCFIFMAVRFTINTREQLISVILLVWFGLVSLLAIKGEKTIWITINHTQCLNRLNAHGFVWLLWSAPLLHLPSDLRHRLRLQLQCQHLRLSSHNHLGPKSRLLRLYHKQRQDHRHPSFQLL